ncbi:MAG TPA: hypothetical protein VGD87_05690 [Archangium sp.]
MLAAPLIHTRQLSTAALNSFLVLDAEMAPVLFCKRKREVRFARVIMRAARVLRACCACNVDHVFSTRNVIVHRATRASFIARARACIGHNADVSHSVQRTHRAPIEHRSSTDHAPKTRARSRKSDRARVIAAVIGVVIAAVIAAISACGAGGNNGAACHGNPAGSSSS